MGKQSGEALPFLTTAATACFAKGSSSSLAVSAHAGRGKQGNVTHA
jgi:hypothetical protein